MPSLVQPVILAGGAGTRLWPESVPAQPKHLLEIVGSGTMVEQTLARVADPEMFRLPLIVGAKSQADRVASLAPSARLILEPRPCGSAAAIAFAALAVERDAMLLVLPSDHHITDTAPLIDAVRRALPVAETGRLITFGIQPKGPETGYGYITVGEAVVEGVLDVKAFVEKPAADVAADLVSSGKAYWNSGMFMFQAGALLDELKKHAPAIHEAAASAVRSAANEGSRIVPDLVELEDCPSTSIDYAVMENSDRIAVVPIDLDWSDVGSWAAVYDLGTKDENGNVLSAGAHAIDARGCLIRTKGRKVVAVGVDDLVVIEAGDYVLIVPRSDAQRVREAAEQAKSG